MNSGEIYVSLFLIFWHLLSVFIPSYPLAIIRVRMYKPFDVDLEYNSIKKYITKNKSHGVANPAARRPQGKTPWILAGNLSPNTPSSSPDTRRCTTHREAHKFIIFCRPNPYRFQQRVSVRTVCRTICHRERWQACQAMSATSCSSCLLVKSSRRSAFQNA